MEDDQEFGFRGLSGQPPPFLVSLYPFTPSASPSPRRLSSSFTQRSRPVRAARQLAWVSLQGRLVGAAEASSARTIGGGLSPEEAVAWELFSPIHRILIVAVVAVAVAHSKKNKEIFQLRKSVELRDQVLSSMQQKLDNLCEQVNYFKDQSETELNIAASKNLEFEHNGTFSDRTKLVCCRCQLCDQHKPFSNDFGVSNGEEVFKYKMPLTNNAEPEERRMSDLSDWAPSIASSVDTQLNTLAIEQDIYNLRKESEKKDGTIKELSTLIHSSKVVGSKRIAELEDIIRRKNMIITKLRKDMLVLEQKVVNLTRLRRPSFSTSSSNKWQLPVMADNLIYDMDSTTSPSSSDSDCSPRTRPQLPVAKTKSKDIPVQNNDSASIEDKKLGENKGSTSLVKLTNQGQKSRPVSPLKEKSMNQTPDSIPILKPKKSLSASGDSRSRRRAPTKLKDATSQKRWV